MTVRSPSSLQALQRLRSPGHGLHASEGELFRDAIFGRDSLETAEDILSLVATVSGADAIAREVILTMVALQGGRWSPTGRRCTEEEPGRIHHEFRAQSINGRRNAPGSDAIMRYQESLFGSTDITLPWVTGNSMIIYDSIDSTPLFIRLVGRYVREVDGGILHEVVATKDGTPRSVGEALRLATEWLVARIRDSDIGLLEFRRRNPSGHPYQTWKDSPTSHVHMDGTFASPARGIASVSVQALAFDALREAAAVFADSHPRPAAEWVEMADALRERTLREFWMPSSGYFAMAVDRDPDGRPRQVATPSSDPGILLDSGLLEPTSTDDYEPYVTGIIGTIFSDDFLTDVGIRCRSAAVAGLVDFHDYHGSWTVWPKETFDIARGLRRHGFGELAAQLEARIVNAVATSGHHYEYLYVAPDGKVDLTPVLRGAHTEHIGARVILGPTIPQYDQAWTVTAAVASKVAAFAPPVTPASAWGEQLQRGVLAGIRHWSRAHDRDTADEIRSAIGGRFSIDTRVGLAAEERARELLSASGGG